MSDYSKAQEARPRMKWEQIILVIALALFLAGLAIVSVVSFFQTETAFRSLNDTSIKGIGLLISLAFAFIFQYGQNAALYIRKNFCDGKILFNIYMWEVTDKHVLLSVFWIFAAVDALTNIVWFYKTVEVNPDPFLNVVVRGLGYAAMIIAVFVEEVLGKTLDAFSRALKELDTILKWEKRSIKSEKTNKYRSSLPAKTSYEWGAGDNTSSKPRAGIRRPAPAAPVYRGTGSFPGDELGTSLYEYQENKYQENKYQENKYQENYPYNIANRKKK